MTLEEIQWMIDLFETGKVSKSAENLFITQPALSQCLHRVEKQLGFSLFERTSRGLYPTPKGELFRDAAKKIQRDYEIFQAQVEEMDRAGLRDFTIGMAPHFSSCCSPQIMAMFQKRYPDMTIHIQEDNTHVLLEALEKHEVQMLILNEPLEKPEYTIYRFGNVRNAVFLRAGSPAEAYVYEKDGTRYLDPKYLKDEPICATRTGFSSRVLYEAIIREAGISPQIIHESQNISTLYRYAREGVASAIAPLTYQVMEQARQYSKQVIYRIPESYEMANGKVAVCALPNIEKILPDGLLEEIAQAVANSPYIAI